MNVYSAPPQKASPTFPSAHTPINLHDNPIPMHVWWYFFYFHTLAVFCLKSMDRWTDLCHIIIWSQTEVVEWLHLRMMYAVIEVLMRFRWVACQAELLSRPAVWVWSALDMEQQQAVKSLAGHMQTYVTVYQLPCCSTFSSHDFCHLSDYRLHEWYKTGVMNVWSMMSVQHVQTENPWLHIYNIFHVVHY